MTKQEIAYVTYKMEYALHHYNIKNDVITAALFFANGLKTSVNQCALN